MSNSDSSFAATCFRPATSDSRHCPPPPLLSGKPNLATCIYQTDLGLFSLTWSGSLLGRSVDLHLHSAADFSTSPSPSPSFHLNINPFFFWRKNGSKTAAPAVRIFWDLSRAKFGSGPEPVSGFYIAVVVDGEMTLLIGDTAKRAYAKTKARKPPSKGQFLLLRREHAVGNRVYTTRARFGGKTREITVSCGGAGEDARLVFSVDAKKVLQVKHLKWKFRGNETIEVDGVAVQVSWDVYNWLFDDAGDAHAVFIFRFENESGVDDGESGNGAAVSSPCSLGMNGVELRKMRKSILKSSGRSSSSSSVSSASSACSWSVMEWASTEESDRLSGPTGFSLVVYAWKK